MPEPKAARALDREMAMVLVLGWLVALAVTFV
jgi:hypothetical protein